MSGASMLITAALTDPVYYFSAVVVVMFSTVLHELGHAWAALWEGDSTPRDLGHLDFNPLTHMGPFSLVALFIIGLAWGQCPVNPRRFRHRTYGEAVVSFAGPAMNFLLMVAFSVVFAAWQWVPASAFGDNGLHQNLFTFFQVGAVMNGALFFLNLVPIPPLDGFTVLTSLVPSVREHAEMMRQNAMLFLVLLLFVGIEPIFHWSYVVVGTVSGITQVLLGLVMG